MRQTRYFLLAALSALVALGSGPVAQARQAAAPAAAPATGPSLAPFWTGTPDGPAFERAMDTRLAHPPRPLAHIAAVRGPPTLPHTPRPHPHPPPPPPPPPPPAP